MQKMARQALLLDRDGTLIYDRHYLADPAGVALIPGAREALHQALAFGWLLFLHTNQSGVGYGYYTLEAVHACNARMLELLELPEPGFIEIKIAPESPGQPAEYRKPSPQFIDEMVTRYSLDRQTCWMIGDRDTDLKAGLNAGIQTAAVATGPPFSEATQTVINRHRIPIFTSLMDLVTSLVLNG